MARHENDASKTAKQNSEDKLKELEGIIKKLKKHDSVIDQLQTQLSQILGEPDKIPKIDVTPKKEEVTKAGVVEVIDKNIDGDGSYWVVDPYFNFKGKSYSEWVSDWFNWFVSADADKRTFGPMVFVRSKGLPSKRTGANIPDVPGEKIGAEIGDSFPSDPYLGMGSYVNQANVKVGGDRIQIFENQAVLIPIITAYQLIPPSKDWGTLHEYVGLIIDNGDNPPAPNQLTINGKDVVLPNGRKMEDFRIVTPLFTAVVPDVSYGRSIKDFLEEPVVPGTFPAMVDGYFVMVRFTEGHYWVHSWASAGREAEGPYFSELLYQIEVVKPKDPIGVRTAYRPARNEQLLANILEKNKKTEELNDKEVTRFKKYRRLKVL